MTPDWSARLARVGEACAAHSVEAILISAPANITYLSGFAGSAGLLLCGSTTTWLIVDGRYESFVRERRARGELALVEPVRVERRYDLTLEEVVRRAGHQRVAFEAGHVTVATLRRWQERLPQVDWHPTEGIVERLRLIKDAAEIAILRRAAGALSDVARHAKAWVREGRAERDVASDIDRALVRGGFSGPAFPTIVASGPNSAHPHARPTDRSIRTGDLVLLDFGGVLDGYCVDLTRMACVGQPAPQAAALFAAVHDAQDAARRTVRPGVAASAVDQAARQVLHDRGFGAAFLHGTGHGLGLEVHEAPRLGRADSGAEETLEAGMVCTLEPGAYIEGLGGVRLEDDVLVTAEGCEVLTTAPRDLMAV